MATRNLAAARPGPRPAATDRAATGALADVPYVIGGNDRGKHAVSHARATAALAQPHGRGPQAGTVCGQDAVVVPKWGSFEATNPLFASYLTGRCPDCAWLVALEQHTEQDELAALAPAAADLPALTQLLPDPQLAVRICEAILADRSCDPDHPHKAQLLGHAAAHAPVLLVHEECAEGSCDHSHDDEGQSRTCDFPDAAVGCAACSVRAGGWAGECEGQYTPECTVAAPCDVLRTLARHYNIPLGR